MRRHGQFCVTRRYLHGLLAVCPLLTYTSPTAPNRQPEWSTRSTEPLWWGWRLKWRSSHSGHQRVMTAIKKQGCRLRLLASPTKRSHCISAFQDNEFPMHAHMCCCWFPITDAATRPVPQGAIWVKYSMESAQVTAFRHRSCKAISLLPPT